MRLKGNITSLYYKSSRAAHASDQSWTVQTIEEEWSTTPAFSRGGFDLYPKCILMIVYLLVLLKRQWLSDTESSSQCRRCKRRGLDPWVRRSPGEGKGNPLQYSCLKNPMDRGAWLAAVQGVARVRHDLATKQQQQKGTNGLTNQIPPAQGMVCPSQPWPHRC